VTGVTPEGAAWYRKRAVTVCGIPWTGANEDAVTAFAGGGKFTPYALAGNGALEVWNEQERHWLPCPVGHVVMRGALGELYPVSPAALRCTYDPVASPGTGRKTPGQAVHEAQHAAVRRRFGGIAEIRWGELSGEAQAEWEDIARDGVAAYIEANGCDPVDARSVILEAAGLDGLESAALKGQVSGLLTVLSSLPGLAGEWEADAKGLDEDNRAVGAQERTYRAAQLRECAASLRELAGGLS
jgi:hypothetical protein